MNKFQINKLIITKLAIWCILTSFGVILFSGCTTPRSVGYNLKPKNHNTKDKDIAKSTISDESQSQANVVNKSPTQNVQNMPNEVTDRLPTLREQMKIIADKQAEIETDVEVIKSEINLIKAEIIDLKANLLNQGKIKPNAIVTGESNVQQNRNKQKQIEEETFLLPDEQDAPPKKETKTNTNKPAPKPQPPLNIKPKVLNTPNTKSIENKNDNISEKNIDENQNNSEKIEEPKTNSVHEKIKLAESLINSGKKEEAKRIFQEILIQNPKSELTPIAKKMLQQL